MPNLTRVAVNGHIESHYNIQSRRWSEPEFIRDPFLKLHGLSPAINYGQQAYEGLKAFRTPADEIVLFRPSSNASRMNHSAEFISLPTVPESHFLRCVHLATALNAEFVPPPNQSAALYIRPILYGSSPNLALSPTDGYTFCVFVVPVGVYHGVQPVDCLILEEFDRAAPEGTGSAKVGGNYAPVMRWTQKAKTEGYGITLHLDSLKRAYIDEFSTSGFVGIKEEKEGFTVVVPDSKNVIKSVTSDSVCVLAQSFGWNVEYRPIPYAELLSFTEVIAAGTAAALVSVKSISMKSQGETFVYGDGSGEPGPAFTRLLSALQDIQQGKIKDSFGWLEPVAEPSNYSVLVDGKEAKTIIGQTL